MMFINFTRSYFRQHKKLVVLLCLFVMIFGGVFSLYRLETESVLYATLLCATVGLIALGVDFAMVYRRHLLLTAFGKDRFLDPNALPAAKKPIECDYAALIKKLCDDNRQALNVANQSRREREEYYTLWAHQIKSPVAAMRLLFQSTDHPQSEALLLELFKIEQYVDMVLSYIRLESETSDFLIRRCPVDDIVRGAVRKYAPLFVRKKLALDLREIDCDVLTDEKWLAFVVEQVLSNALKYTNTGKISIYVEGNTLVIADSGIGIAAEDLPRIGQKGFTGYNGRTDKKATGIGLFLCKNICQKLGHRFTVESQMGSGTRVYISLDSMAPCAE